MRNNHWGRADALVALERFAEALIAFDKAVENTDEKHKPEVRNARASALAQSGDYQAARESVDKEAAAEFANRFTCFDGAKVLIRCAEAAKQDEAIDESRREDVSSELLGAAVDALRHAFELGYFTNERELAELDQSEFQLLATRDDFAELRASIQAELE